MKKYKEKRDAPEFINKVLAVRVPWIPNGDEIFSCGGQKREFTWQVQGIQHIVKILRGRLRNPHHGSYVLRSKGSIPERGYIFGT